MRFPLLACLLLALPAVASAGSIGIVRTDASRCFTADSDPACREIGTTVDDNVSA